jgi:hypothetical protein
MCKRIVDSLKGKLYCQSMQNRGTTMVVDIPVVLNEEDLSASELECQMSTATLADSEIGSLMEGHIFKARA